jgi:hypothetical protein
MKREYELFEKFPDGSSLWRDSIPGFQTTRLRLQELARTSVNEFYALNLATGEILAFNPGRDAHGFREPLRSERRGKGQAA